MDQHQQLVHQEVITVVVEVKHMLMIHDVVDHHFIKNKITDNEQIIGDILYAQTLIEKFFLYVMVNQEM